MKKAKKTKAGAGASKKKRPAAKKGLVAKKRSTKYAKIISYLKESEEQETWRMIAATGSAESQ